MVEFHTDGSCYNSHPDKPGGWSYCRTENGEVVSDSGKTNGTTNNRMEMMGAIEALKSLPDNSEARIISDSQYVVNTITKGWKRKKNQDLWAMMDFQISRMKFVEFQWVKGHDGNAMNEMADTLCSYKK